LAKLENKSHSDAMLEGRLAKLLSDIKLLSLDVDGVLTDGGLYYAEDGSIQRKFSVRDGVGIVRAREAGIVITIISAGISGSIPARAASLGIKHVFTGVEDKLEVFESLCTELGIEMSATAHIGDDINDVALMDVVGVAIAVANASLEAREAADYVTMYTGGNGAVREVCDALIQSRQHP